VGERLWAYAEGGEVQTSEFFPQGQPGAGADDPEAVQSLSLERFNPNWACSKPAAIWSDLRADPALSRRLGWRPES